MFLSMAQRDRIMGMKVVSGSRLAMKAPFRVDWTPQLVRLAIAGVETGAKLAMSQSGMEYVRSTP